MLLTLQDVKDAFPAWEKYCTLQQYDTQAEIEERLRTALGQAEGELRDYVAVSGPDDLTQRFERHLMAIVKYNAFQIRYAHEDYDTKPTIVRNYERTIESLEALRAGTQPEPYDPTTSGGDDDTGDVRIQSKRRRFDEWFSRDDF
jgi:hypothetical protein